MTDEEELREAENSLRTIFSEQKWHPVWVARVDTIMTAYRQVKAALEAAERERVQGFNHGYDTATKQFAPLARDEMARAEKAGAKLAAMAFDVCMCDHSREDHPVGSDSCDGCDGCGKFVIRPHAAFQELEAALSEAQAQLAAKDAEIEKLKRGPEDEKVREALGCRHLLDDDCRCQDILAAAVRSLTAKLKEKK